MYLNDEEVKLLESVLDTFGDMVFNDRDDYGDTVVEELSSILTIIQEKKGESIWEEQV